MKAAAAVMSLLAMVVVATAAAASPPDAVDHQAAAGGIAGTLRGRDVDDDRSSSDDDRSSALTDELALLPLQKKGSLGEMTTCLGICATQTSTCYLNNCSNPPLRDPFWLPLCLLNCSNAALRCSAICADEYSLAPPPSGTLLRGRDVDDRSSSSSDDDQSSALTELALCMTSCGSNVTVCMIKCYEPLSRGKGNPVTTPLCLLACTTKVMSCATKCPSNMAG